MEKKLRHGLMSLEEISLRRVAVLLWGRSDTSMGIGDGDDDWLAQLSLKKLKLPSSLAERVMDLIKPIISEIRHFKRTHEKYLSMNIAWSCMIDNLKYLCWTNLGTLDYRKTVENLIRDERFDTVMLYRLACLYCLDEYIPILWEKLPEENKNFYYKEEGPLEFFNPEIDFCWPYILKGEERRLNDMPYIKRTNVTSFNQYAFEHSAYNGHRAASEYFFRKLPDDVKENSLSDLAEGVLFRRFDEFESRQVDNLPDESISDRFFYLLSLVKPEQQMEIFEKHAFKVLVCLLDWPWQDLFLDIAELIWNFLDADDYVSILQEIIQYFKSGSFRKKLFQGFFLLGSSDFKKHFLDEECKHCFFFKACFDIEDLDTIRFIFRNVDSVNRKTLVSTEPVFDLFYWSILTGDGHLVGLCLQGATLSKEDKEEIKEAYGRFLTENEPLYEDTEKSRWKQFIRFLD